MPHLRVLIGIIYGTVSIRVPYKNLKHDADSSVEMVQFEEEAAAAAIRRIGSDKSNVFPNGNCKKCLIYIYISICLSCTVAAGVQFGWALQLSLLTPYIQTLGIGHAFSSFIWLCGPITGLVLSWFPFFLFDTDWMGREVYHGDPKGNDAEIRAYHEGVREGAFGLLLNSVVLGISSFLIEPMCKWIDSKFVWAGTAILTFISLKESRGTENAVGGNEAIKSASLVVFAILGLPLAITYSVPFSVTADLTADTGGGQGLVIGVLNLAIVIPQMIVSLGAGPWDALFGGGNVPAFLLASLSALAAGLNP